MDISPYDSFAWFYNRYFAFPFERWQSRALEELLYPALGQSDQVLDLCCGTGQTAKLLTVRGYMVTGIDSSPQMLAFARQNVPNAMFLQSDATDFALQQRVNAVVCFFDSLNHLLQPEDLERAFHNVHAALKPGSLFLFDINTGAAYGDKWDQSFCEVQPDHAFFLRGKFDQQTRIGYTYITMFRIEESWKRSDVELRQRPWEVPEVTQMLRRAGFEEIRSYRAIEDLGMCEHYGIGRVYVSARAVSRQNQH